MAIIDGQDGVASDFISSSAGASDVGKVPKLDALGKLNGSFNYAPTFQVYTTGATKIGSSTTRFDITNISGTTYRYTWDGTGTDPGISSVTMPIGSTVEIIVTNMSSGNRGLFVVTGSGTNYFQITNASGVAENDKTIGPTGSVSIQNTQWTKPTGLQYILIQITGAGGGGSGAFGGNVGNKGGSTIFGTHIKATGGDGGDTTNKTGPGGIGTLGDLNLEGQTGIHGYEEVGIGGASFFGKSGGNGGNPTSSSSGDGGSTGGGAGGYSFKKILATSLGSTEIVHVGTGGEGGSGTGSGITGESGVIFISEYY